MKRKSTIKKELEAMGFTVIEREDTLVLAQELQEESLYSAELGFHYAPYVHGNYDTEPSADLRKVAGKDWFWECEFPTCFKLYEA